MMRKTIVITWLVLIFGAIGATFWYSELKYQLPTPIPTNYKNVKRGEFINLNNYLSTGGSKPVFLHFFNPDCPCSRFNMACFKTLVKSYGNKVNFVIVVMNNDSYTVKNIQDKFDLNIPVLFNASIARACGVYSTPQAVLINTHHNLYYRGNYNRSRYCNDEKTNFAKIAIDSLLNNNALPNINPLALQAYGCTLPNCNKTE
ncbi:DUF6436 domain-containing protein [Mucilaginibacter gracilis]|nr:redoxin family protein [Mucilaginibacter gracilis]